MVHIGWGHDGGGLDSWNGWQGRLLVVLVSSMTEPPRFGRGGHTPLNLPVCRRLSIVGGSLQGRLQPFQGQGGRGTRFILFTLVGVKEKVVGHDVVVFFVLQG